jgi:hypothetical protein
MKYVAEVASPRFFRFTEKLALGLTCLAVDPPV